MLLEELLCFVIVVLALALLATACVVVVESLVRGLKNLYEPPTNRTATRARRIERQASRELDQMLGGYTRQAHSILNEARRAARDG